MREQIRKKIKNEDLYEGCREAFENGWQQVKLYFLCGLPGERHGRPRRHRRHGRDDRADRQGGDGPLQGGDGARVELRAQAAHAVPVERHADARVLPLGRRVPAPAQAGSKR